jgi:hypothetical protein
MTEQHGALVLADISGYTQFTRLHFTSLLHAEAIISELLETVIHAAQFPLKVSQLEGDAVLLYAEVNAGDEAQAAHDVAQQITQLFAMFNARERALIACDNGCVCEACQRIGQLRLKTVLHFGAFTLKQIQHITEITSPDVKLLRELIKAPLPTREYVLMTERFYTLSGGWEHRPPDEQRTVPAAGTALPVMVYYPRRVLEAAVTRESAAAFAGRLNQYAFARMLGRRARAPFNNLTGEGLNLALYLMEGILSGVNVLKKTARTFMPLPSQQMTIKPLVLVLIECTRPEHLQVLLESIQPPLVLNKLEGDAALLYALSEDPSTAHQVARQAEVWLRQTPGPLKVLLHVGQAAFKTIQQFEEIAGTDVILIHRLLKNSVPYMRYALLTNTFYQRVGTLDTPAMETRTETAEGLGAVEVQIFKFE